MKNRLSRLGLLAAAAAVASLPYVSRATDLFWTNSGVINTPPQIDAVNFVNDGTMNLASLNPFETSNTRNFTNSGIMYSSPGWFFDHAPTLNGYRSSADNFVNLTSGEVRAFDPAGGFIIGLGGRVLLPSYLWVSATNIINRGVMGVGANGWMKLEGSTITMNRARLDVEGISPTGSFNDFQNAQFQPDAGIVDVWWGGTNIASPPGLNTAGIWQGPFGGATAPPHDVTRYPNFPGRVSFRVLNPIADSYAETNAGIFISLTNVVGITNITGPTITNVDFTNIVVENVFIPTNITRQGVFVGVNDPSRQFVNVTWFNSSSPTNFFKAPQVEISTLSTNVVDDVEELSSIFFADTLASTTNRGLLANIASAANLTSYRPANYVLARLPIMGVGFSGNGYPDNDLLYDRNTFSNSVVAAEYAAYSAFVDYLPSELPTIPAGTVTNLPGRIQVYADSLDLRRTRMRGQGEIIIDTEHLVGSSNAVVDGPHLSFTLRSTNNNLRVVDLTKPEVARTKGPIRAWSAVWQNEMILVSDSWTISNTNFDDTGTNVISIDLTNAPVTNLANVGLYALVLDASAMQATLPVTVWDFVTHSKSVVVEDQMTVVQKFFMDAEDFTLNGGIRLSNAFWTTSIGTTFFTAVPDWTSTNAPNLLNFTNNGFLRVPNEIHFGDDRPNPYNNFVNSGTIQGTTMTLESGYFLHTGTWNIQGPLTIVGGTGDFDGPTVDSGSMRVTAGNFRINNSQIDALDLALDISGVLADTGLNASNSITVYNGFHLLRRTTAGDLLGTTIRSTLPNFMQIDHTWSGADRGPSPSGYQDNAALGSLIIGPIGKDPLAYFKGSQPGSALYVDYLDIFELGEDWDEFLEIDPSITIYYATVRAGFTPPPLPNGIPQLPEEYLDGKFDGRLRWVRDYAGGRSSVAVVVDGVTVYMNTALRNSRIIDSDDDGVPNYFDSTPLGGSTPGAMAALTLRPSLINPAGPAKAKAFSMSWTAAPNAVYQIEVATDLVQADWQPLTLYTNNSSTAQTATFSDSITPSFGQRFYRVRKK